MVDAVAKEGVDLEAGINQEEDLRELNTSTEVWIPPTEEMREMVREMLGRAIDILIRLNEENGFEYELGYPQSQYLAVAIEDYCYQIRLMPFQNKITLVTDLMNLEGVTPELFYGPIPHIRPGEELLDPYGEFAYRTDEFGDLVGEYLYIDPEWQLEQELRQEDFQMLMEQGQFAPFQQFPGMGLLGNPMTRNMKEIPERVDPETGYPMGLAVAPVPLGLRDIFSTVSTGKININTASIPVIYGLLLSLSEDEAFQVARDIDIYRQSYQDIAEEDPTTGEAIEPRRRRKCPTSDSRVVSRRWNGTSCTTISTRRFQEWASTPATGLAPKASLAWAVRI